MKKIIVFLVSIVSMISLSTIKVEAFYIDPPFGSIEISDMDEYPVNMDYFGGAIEYRSLRCTSSNMGVRNYYRAYKAKKVISIPVIEYTSFMEVLDGQEFSLTYQVSEENISTSTYEELISNTVSCTLGAGIEGKIENKILGIGVTGTLSSEISSTVDTSVKTSYTREKRNFESITKSYTLTEPGYYIAQQRKIFECYLFQEFCTINDWVNGRPGRLIGNYFIRSYIKLVPTLSPEVEGLYRYTVAEDGINYNIDTTNLNALDQRVYI